MNEMENLYNSLFPSDKKQINITFSIEEAKIIFDALSSHRFKISRKKDGLNENIKDEEKMVEFISSRLKAIDNEIARTDEIFNKIGRYVKDEDNESNEK